MCSLQFVSPLEWHYGLWIMSMAVFPQQLCCLLSSAQQKLEFSRKPYSSLFQKPKVISPLTLSDHLAFSLTKEKTGNLQTIPTWHKNIPLKGFVPTSLRGPAYFNMPDVYRNVSASVREPWQALPLLWEAAASLFQLVPIGCGVKMLVPSFLLLF